MSITALIDITYLERIEKARHSAALFLCRILGTFSLFGYTKSPLFHFLDRDAAPGADRPELVLDEKEVVHVKGAWQFFLSP